MSQTTEHYGLDDLRWFAADLAAGVGLPPERAASLARLLLWHDTVGLPALGLAMLPDWLERLENQTVDPKTPGRILSEHPATADLDAAGGVAPLILVRAAEIAAQKAREVGVGLVRVRQLGPQPFALHVAAELAIGPQSALVVGPEGAWAVGVPSADGLPLVLGSELGSDPKRLPPLPTAVSALLVPDRVWVIQAFSAPAFESVSQVHDRVARWLSEADSLPRLDPSDWESRRASARDRGLTIERSAWKALSQRAKTANLPLPSPLKTSKPDRD